MLSRSRRKWATSDFSFSVRGSDSGTCKGWKGVSVDFARKDVRADYTGKRGVGLGLSRSSSGSQGRSTPPIL